MMKFLLIHMRYFNAFAIRIFLVILSEILLKFNITYTDIDYHVFNDGAKHLLSLESPYNRETYRYTPLLAFMMIPNQILNINYGKIVFVFVDILNGICIEILLNLQNTNRKKIEEERERKLIAKQARESQNLNFKTDSHSLLSENSSNLSGNNNQLEHEDFSVKFQLMFEILKKIVDNPFAYTSLLYLYNPFVINMSTRGSADCLIIFFILLTLIFLELRIYSIAGILYGLAMHFKIYPVIYAPAILLYIIFRRKKLTFESDEESISTENLAPVVKSPKQRKNFITKIIYFALSFFSFYFYLGIANSIFKKIKNFFAVLFSQFKNFIRFFFKYIFNLNAVVFFGFALFTFLALFSFFYLFFGRKFVFEYLLYHVVRKDHRHNYSVFSYLMYLTYSTSFGKVLSLMAFLPQALLVFLTSIFMFNNLNTCLLIITWIFVTFNKVVTAQYYLWYLSFIPLITPFNKMFTQKRLKAYTLFGIWLYLEVYWNNFSHRLEFKGQSLFLEIWILNMVFFLVNCVMIEEIASDEFVKKEIK